MKKLVLFLLLMNCNIAYAHSDWFYESTNGNVRTSIKTGWDYEEIRRMEMIGKLANILSEELNSNQAMYIYLNHLYTTPNASSQYYVSCSSTEQNETILISCYCNRIDPVTVLKLAEYAALNKNDIKKTQQPITIKLPHEKTKEIISIPNETINKLLTATPSIAIVKTIANKIYRPLRKNEFVNISYFYQNNKYFVFKKEFVRKNGEYVDNEITVKELDDIYQFSVVSYEHALVFDTDKSFYFIDGARLNGQYAPKEEVSKRHIISYMPTCRPYGVFPIGADRICITIHDSSDKPFKKYYGEAPIKRGIGKEYNMLYIADNDVLIQNADKIFDEAAMKQLGLVSTNYSTVVFSFLIMIFIVFDIVLFISAKIRESIKNKSHLLK